MPLKHNLSILYTQNDPFWGMMIELNTATSGFLGWAILILVFAISVWVATKQTQDLGKSLISGLWITTLIAFILFYAGKATVIAIEAKALVTEIMLLTLLVLVILSVAGIYFLRNKGA